MIQKAIKLLTNQKTLKFFWALVLLCMPVTSFRFFPGDSIWRPLAIFPAIILVGLLVLRLFVGEKFYLPQPTTTIFLILLFVVVGSVLINGIYPPDDYIGQSYWTRSSVSLITIGFGVVFFFVGLQMNRSEEEMMFTLKWIFISFLPLMVAGVIQWAVLFLPLPIDRWDYNIFHEFFMIKGLRIRRIIGFAYEPGWFADQLIFIYIPWFLMALLTGKRILKKWWLELGVVVAGFGLLLFTYSRSGIFSLVIVVGLFFLIFAPRYYKQFIKWFFLPFKMKDKKLTGFLLRLLIIVVVLTSFALVGIIFAHSDFFSKLWNTNLDKGLLNYLQSNNVNSRVVYALMGIEVFLENFWFGVGFGALGFHMPYVFPTGLMDGSIEIARFNGGRRFHFMNAKNMYVRMASETGIFGLVVFLVFLASVMGLVWRVRKNENQNVQFVGGAAFLIVTGIVIRFFTFDSFASPTIWVTLGIVVSLLSTVQSWNSKEGELKDE